MFTLRRIIPVILLSLLVAFNGDAQMVVGEKVSKSKPSRNRARGLEMLENIKGALERYYYDKKYRGIDIDKNFKEAAEKIKTLETNADIFRIIAGLLLEFNDSHTRFFPPDRSNHVEYGFSMQAIGDRVIVIDVTKGSNAEKQGIRPGDVVVRIGQYPVNRDSLWVINYFLYQLEPMTHLPIVIRKADDSESALLIEASFKTLEQRVKEAEARRKEKRENPFKCAKITPELTACKLRTFSVEPRIVEKMMDEVAGSSRMILDLRGNRGGYLKTQEFLTGHFFNREVKIAEMVRRNRSETCIAKPISKRAFGGELVVLIDSNSASASELFARVIQLEKRGKVVGDTSAGAVMTSYNLSMATQRGSDLFLTVSPYGMNVTVGDMIMSDGNRLENIGVSPDIPVGPTGAALAARNDPVLAYAAELLGGKITPEAAGQLNFLYKKLETDSDDEASDEEDPSN